jgi:hypothetical protein
MKNDGTDDSGLSYSEQRAAIMAGATGGGSQQTYPLPTRWKPAPGYLPGSPSSFPGLSGPAFKYDFPVKYDGPNLLDSAGNERPVYDTSDEYAKYVYGTLSPSSRQLAFDVLKDKGFYGGGKVGVFDNDINAIQGWLDYSNTIGYTSDRALRTMIKDIPSVTKAGGGGGQKYKPRINVSSPDDLKIVARKVSMDTLGRAFTDAEANKFVKAYQAQEIDYQRKEQKSLLSGGGDIAVGIPSADVAAEKFAQESAPTEAQGYQFLGYVNQFFKSIGEI